MGLFLTFWKQDSAQYSETFKKLSLCVCELIVILNKT